MTCSENFLEIMIQEGRISHHQEASHHMEREIRVIVVIEDLQKDRQKEETIVITKRDRLQ